MKILVFIICSGILGHIVTTDSLKRFSVHILENDLFIWIVLVGVEGNDTYCFALGAFRQKEIMNSI